MEDYMLMITSLKRRSALLRLQNGTENKDWFLDATVEILEDALKENNILNENERHTLLLLRVYGLLFKIEPILEKIENLHIYWCSSTHEQEISFRTWTNELKHDKRELTIGSSGGSTILQSSSDKFEIKGVGLKAWNMWQQIVEFIIKMILEKNKSFKKYKKVCSEEKTTTITIKLTSIPVIDVD